MEFTFTDSKENSFTFAGQTSAEIQLMHYNKKYGSLANALSHADGNETLHNIMSVTLNLIAIRFGCNRSFYG